MNSDLFGEPGAYSGKFVELLGGISDFFSFLAIVSTVADFRFRDQKLVFF